jgi:hypothetical protein
MRGVPYIVMPAGRMDDFSKASIRHEYTHVLLGYSEHRFPKWYQEGFAEFMSGTTFRDNDTKFTFGEWPGRSQAPGALVAWGELMSDEFEFHSTGSGARVSNAYLQAWLLVHYLTIGDQFSHYEGLTQYLGRYAAGEPSLSALKGVFDMTPDELGTPLAKAYIKKSPYYVLDFKPGMQDHEFTRAEADQDAARDTIETIKAGFRSSWNKSDE